MTRPTGRIAQLVYLSYRIPIVEVHQLTNHQWHRVLARQHGAFGVAQAKAYGVNHSKLNRELRAGRVHRGLPGVYLLAGSARTRLQRAHEVLIWAGEEAALSFTTAAQLLALDVDISTTVHVTTTRNLRAATPDIYVHRVRESLPACDVSEIRGLRLTTMPRTVIDLAGTLTEEPLDIALDSAIRRGMPRRGFLSRFEALRSGRPSGAALLQRLIDERETEQGLPGSAFERRLLRLIRVRRLPMPICQYPVAKEGFNASIDFAYPEFGIAIEADGYRWHDGRMAYENDRDRNSELASWGWRVLQVTWLQLKYRPDVVARRLQRALSTPPIVALRP